MALLSKSDHLRLILINVAQILLLLLDLVAIGLVGIVTSLSVRYIQGKSEGDRVSSIVDFIGIEDYQPQIKIAIFSLLAAFLFVMRSLISYLFSRKTALFVAERAAQLSSTMLGKLFANPLSVVKGESTQSGVYFVTQGISQVLTGVVAPFYALIPEITFAFLVFVSLFYVDALTMIFTTTILLSSAVVLFQIQKRKSSHFGTLSTELNIASSDLAAEVLRAFREISTRSAQSIYIEKISKVRLNLAKAQTLLKLQSILSRYVLEAILTATIFAIGFIQVTFRDSLTSPTNLAIFVAAAARILPSIVKIQNTLLQLKSQLAAADRVLNYNSKLKIQSEKEKSNVRVMKTETPIAFRNVEFSFDLDKSTKYRFNFEVERNKFLVITGQAGVGKSTLLDLALGIQHANKGEVELFGLNPKEFLSENIGKVAYVPQEVYIKNGTLLENLLFALPNRLVSMEQIMKLVDIMKWHDLFRSMEMLEIRLGEGGRVLSGGERQVVGLARALVTEPSLILLDEFTSAMDSLTEERVLEVLKSRPKLTTVVVAHRLNVILHSDKVMFVQSNGKISVGTVSELKETNPEFSSLLNSFQSSK